MDWLEQIIDQLTDAYAKLGTPVKEISIPAEWHHSWGVDVYENDDGQFKIFPSLSRHMLVIVKGDFE